MNDHAAGRSGSTETSAARLARMAQRWARRCFGLSVLAGLFLRWWSTGSLGAPSLAEGLLWSVSLVLLLFVLGTVGRSPVTVLRAAAVGLGLAVGAFVVEVGSFLASPSSGPNPWLLVHGIGLAKDERLPYVRRPNIAWTGSTRGDLARLSDVDDPQAKIVTFVTDSHGFRNGRELSRVDLMFLGDSYTEAGNVAEAETFVQRVARSSGLSAGNYGTAGYSPPEELIVLERQIDRLQPRCVVWQITESNDLPGAARFASAQSGREVVDRSDLRRTLELWADRSVLLGLQARLQRAIWSDHGVHRGVFRSSDGIDTDVLFRWAAPGAAQTTHQHPGLQPLVTALEQGILRARASGVRVLLVLVPQKIRVLGPFVRRPEDRTRPLLAPSEDLAHEVTLSTLLADLETSLQVDVVDLLDDYRRAASSGLLPYLTHDTHLSSLGHRIAAERISDWTLTACRVPTEH